MVRTAFSAILFSKQSFFNIFHLFSEREFHVIYKIESDFCDVWKLTFKCGLLEQKEEVIVVV